MESKYAVECKTCGKLKPSIDPTTEYCCGKQMQIMEVHNNPRVLGTSKCNTFEETL